MLKRNQKISFGNFYAFPGGMIEKQDYIEPWREAQPEWYKEVGSKNPDFTKRVCAMRELFEETNLLYTTKNGQRSGSSEVPTLESYNTKYKTDFVSFMKSCGLAPDINSMYGF